MSRGEGLVGREHTFRILSHEDAEGDDSECHGCEEKLQISD
jgi:hypothetical protein